MERLLLPLLTSQKSDLGMVVTWHIEEGAFLTPGRPLLTLEIANKTIDLFFQERGQEFFLRKKVVETGHFIAMQETLALIGSREEALPLDEEIDLLSVVGTAKVMRRISMCLEVLRRTLLFMLACALLQIFLNFLIPTLSQPTLLFNLIYNFLSLLIGLTSFVLIGASIAYLLQIEPEKRRVVRFREVALQQELYPMQ